MVAETRKPALLAPGIAFIVLALMIVLYSVDQFLARLEQREVQAEGRRLYAESQRSMARNQPHEAVELLSRAHSLERTNQNYQIALAAAQLADQQTDAASSTLNELLERDSNHGPANLLMARAMVADQRFKDADSYFHRAIYGTWADNGIQERINARLELADMLAAHGGNYELLSETLLLQNAAGNDPLISKHIAHLFLQAGSPSRAAQVYRSIISRNPNDVDAYAGLAQAELASGDYKAAHLALVKAFVHSPNDAALRQEMELVGKLLSLDPTPRHISSAEKYRRSLEILNLSEARISGCVAGRIPPPTVEPLIDAANRLKADRPRGAVTNEMAEQRLETALQLWQTRAIVCAGPPEPNDALAVLMKKIEQ